MWVWKTMKLYNENVVAHIYKLAEGIKALSTNNDVAYIYDTDLTYNMPANMTRQLGDRTLYICLSYHK